MSWSVLEAPKFSMFQEQILIWLKENNTRNKAKTENFSFITELGFYMNWVCENNAFFENRDLKSQLQLQKNLYGLKTEHRFKKFKKLLLTQITQIFTDF